MTFLYRLCKHRTKPNKWLPLYSHQCFRVDFVEVYHVFENDKGEMVYRDPKAPA